MRRGLLVVALVLFAASCTPVPPGNQAITSDLETESQIEVTGGSGPGFTPPTLLKEMRVVYPLEAQRLHESGVVKLHAMVGMDGKLKNIEIKGESNLLIAAVDEAARKAEFNPARQDGIPVESWITIPVTFTPSAMNGEGSSSGSGIHMGDHTVAPPDESTRSGQREAPKGTRR